MVRNGTIGIGLKNSKKDHLSSSLLLRIKDCAYAQIFKYFVLLMA
jgi:hypothetical protein